MTLQEARVILDTARNGGLVPARYITEALVVTGDLTPFRRDSTGRGCSARERASMSRNDDSTRPPDVHFRPVGTGLVTTWRCLGCDLSRPTLGSRGLGIRKRCAQCVAKRAAA